MDQRDEFEAHYHKQFGCRKDYMQRFRLPAGYSDPHMETHYQLWLVRDAHKAIWQIRQHHRTGDQGVSLVFSSCRAASEFMAIVARITQKCDGNHGGAFCPDHECWLRD